MEALVYTGVDAVEWRTQPDLRVEGPLEAVVRPVAASTCDLDRRILAGRTPFAPPFPIGHEAVAEVLEVGDLVRTVRVGDLVAITWTVACGVCEPCRRGLPTACRTFPGLAGFGIPVAQGSWRGLFSEQVRVPCADAMLVPVPDGVDPVAVAAVGDNITDAYIAVSNGLAEHPGAAVLVVADLESMGLFAAEHALALGAAHVDYVDTDAGRRAIAATLGAQTAEALPEAPRPAYDVVIGATRDPARLREAALRLAPDGHLSILAIYLGDTPLPLWDLYLRGVTVTFGLPNTRPHMPHVLDLVAQRRIHPERVVRSFPMEQAAEALLAPVPKAVLVRPRTIGQP